MSKIDYPDSQIACLLDAVDWDDPELSLTPILPYLQIDLDCDPEIEMHRQAEVFAFVGQLERQAAIDRNLLLDAIKQRQTYLITQRKTIEEETECQARVEYEAAFADAKQPDGKGKPRSDRHAEITARADADYVAIIMEGITQRRALAEDPELKLLQQAYAKADLRHGILEVLLKAIAQRKDMLVSMNYRRSTELRVGLGG